MTDQPHLPDLAASPATAPLAVSEPPLDPAVAANGAEPARQPGAAMILFDQVTKVYEPNIAGLEDVSLQIDKGEFVFLVGPSGSGKSTFIKLLLKELEVTSGNLIVGGRSLPKLKRSKIPVLRRNIGCVFQDFKLLPNRNVYQNVAYALQVQGKSRARDPAQGARHPRAGRPGRQERPVPERAVGRRAAARLGGARVRQPPAAPDRRRAHRQPRPRHLRRHHAAAVPHQPRRHHRRDGDARPRDGRQDAPPRDPARERPGSCATTAAGATRHEVALLRLARR